MADERAWRLEGYDTFSRESYPLGGRYESREQAERAALRRLEELERSQPAAETGGQAPDGLQDRVFVLGPDGERYRFTG